jgi:hypothetical protein
MREGSRRSRSCCVTNANSGPTLERTSGGRNALGLRIATRAFRMRRCVLVAIAILCLGSVSCGATAPAPTTPTPVSSPAPPATGGTSGGTYDAVIRATEAPCDSHRTFGDHQGKPCHRYAAFDLPLPGTLRIQLSWPQSSTNDLEFEVWRNGLPYTESGNDFGSSDSISGGAPAGSYEVRVVYLGATSRTYRLTVAFAWN